MDIMNLNQIPLTAVNSASNATSLEIGTAMLDMQLDVTNAMSAQMIKAMENSVNPAIGSNIDISV